MPRSNQLCPDGLFELGRFQLIARSNDSSVSYVSPLGCEYFERPRLKGLLRVDYDAGDFNDVAACLPFAEQLLPDLCTHHYDQMNNEQDSVQGLKCKKTL